MAEQRRQKRALAAAAAADCCCRWLALAGRAGERLACCRLSSSLARSQPAYYRVQTRSAHFPQVVASERAGE